MNPLHLLIFCISILGCINLVQAQEFTFINIDPPLNQLKKFTSDGCTGVPTNLSNFNSYDDFAHCCLVHDIVYWIGGSSTDKDYADNELITCFNDANAITNITNVASAITLDIFGWDHWGKGWQTTHFANEEFTKQEISEVITKLKELNDKKDDFSFQFRMNDRQFEYINFWLETFIKGFSSFWVELYLAKNLD